MLGKFVSDFATLEKDEQQREKERLRELEQELARMPEEPDRASSVNGSQTPEPDPGGGGGGGGNASTAEVRELRVKLAETERVLARNLKRMAALEERAAATDRAQKDRAAVVSEAARLQGRVEELTAANAELSGMVGDLTSRLALCRPADPSDLDRKMDELSRVYELLSKTEAKLNAAEAAAAEATHARDTALAKWRSEAAAVAALQGERDAAVGRVAELGAALAEAMGSSAYLAAQELRTQLQERERQHHQELVRLHETAKQSEGEWRARVAEIEAAHREALRRLGAKADAKKGAGDLEAPEGRVEGAALETWCARLAVGFVVCSVLLYLFLRRVVPHTTICMRDMTAAAAPGTG